MLRAIELWADLQQKSLLAIGVSRGCRHDAHLHSLAKPRLEGRRLEQMIEKTSLYKTEQQVATATLMSRRLGEHRRWSQNGHNKSAILTS
jgi:hypothetical protein